MHLTGSKIRVNRNPQSNDIDPQTVGLNVSSLASNFLYMAISGYFNIGCGSCAPAVYASGAVQVADDIDIIRGRHHFLFGANYIYDQLNEDNVFLGNGYWTFNGQASGDSLVDFLMGSPNSFEQGNPAVGNPRQDYAGAYAQDDFQITRGSSCISGCDGNPFSRPPTNSAGSIISALRLTLRER